MNSHLICFFRLYGFTILFQKLKQLIKNVYRCPKFIWRLVLFVGLPGYRIALRDKLGDLVRSTILFTPQPPNFIAFI